MINAARNCLLIVLAAVAALLLLGGMAHAGHCRIKVRQQIVVAQPVYAYPVQQNLFYSVGESARFEVLLNKKLAALAQQQAATPDIALPAPDTAANVSSSSLLKAKCAKCHKDFDGNKPISCETFHRFSEMAMLGNDVPAEMKPLIGNLKDDEFTGLLSEMLKLKSSESESEAGVLK